MGLTGEAGGVDCNFAANGGGFEELYSSMMESSLYKLPSPTGGSGAKD